MSKYIQRLRALIGIWNRSSGFGQERARLVYIERNRVKVHIPSSSMLLASFLFGSLLPCYFRVHRPQVQSALQQDSTPRVLLIGSPSRVFFFRIFCCCFDYVFLDPHFSLHSTTKTRNLFFFCLTLLLTLHSVSDFSHPAVSLQWWKEKFQ